MRFTLLSKIYSLNILTFIIIFVMVLVRLKEEEQKRGIEKEGGTERKERIEEDYTCREKKMMWKLREIARAEEGRGRRVWVGYGKMRIDGDGMRRC